MNEQLFNIILLIISIIGITITKFIIPYLKTVISTAKMEQICKWISKAVDAAEVLFNTPKSGDEKREYVINFIDKMFNSKKEIISRDQIRILLEAAWKEMNKNR